MATSPTHLPHLRAVDREANTTRLASAYCIQQYKCARALVPRVGFQRPAPLLPPSSPTSFSLVPVALAFTQRKSIVNSRFVCLISLSPPPLFNFDSAHSHSVSVLPLSRTSLALALEGRSSCLFQVTLTSLHYALVPVSSRLSYSPTPSPTCLEPPTRLGCSPSHSRTITIVQLEPLHLVGKL
ncbi:hypothetical protein C8Q79DRAFT_1012126 [Trametes meyenii]|nr:hypothetical protein C8Q79DRAFT_1012126 [Trametes meyenii]